MKVLNKTRFLTFPLLLALLLTQVNNGDGKQTESKNILFFLGCGSYSMRISMWPLVEGLTEQGHNVTFISALKSKSPNPRVFDFVPKKLHEWWNEVDGQMDIYQLRKDGMLIPFWLGVPQFGIEVCEKLYEDSEALEWIQKSKFDLVVIDSFVNECAYGLAHVFQAKTIVFSTSTIFPWFYEIYGIPDDSSWAISDCALGLPVRNMNFFQRATNALMPIVWKFIREWYYLPKLEEITKKGLKLDSVPSFSELEKNTSLTLVTTHYSQEFARAFPPNVIPISGLAVTEKVQPLPKEIQEFIDRGKNGFIYISFGTVGEFSQLDTHVKEAFVHALLQFPQFQFVWKSTKGVGVELPENFLVLKWVPQLGLLAHPKIKAFITHAGLGGINEAMQFGVPLISFPIFAEQDHNSYLVEAKQIGVKLEITELKTEQLQKAIRDITESSRIKENMQKMSQVFKDRPQSSLQTALWWTEFVLKHDSSELSEFLRPLSVNQPWWVKRQLDVWLFIFTVVLVVLSVLLYALKCCVKSVWRKLFKHERSGLNAKKAKQN